MKLAAVRPLSSVCAHVDLEIFETGEGLGASRELLVQKERGENE